jgi:hypothetical protein
MDLSMRVFVVMVKGNKMHMLMIDMTNKTAPAHPETSVVAGIEIRELIFRNLCSECLVSSERGSRS